MSRRALVTASILVQALATPSAVAARDSVPDEPPATPLPGLAAQVVVADLDGDGSREVVRLLGAPGPGSVVDAIRSTGGAWESAGEWLVRGSSFRLLVWRDDGRERVLVVGSSLPPGELPGTPGACCTTITAVEMAAGRLLVRPLAEDLAGSHAALAVDLDGDATDELILAQAGGVAAMGWTGDGFEQIDVIELTRGDGQTPVAIGDSDGEPGDEALLVEAGPTGTSAGGFLVRVGLGSEGLRVDSSPFPPGSTSDTGVAAVGDSRVVIVGADRTQVADWPAGGPLQPGATVDVGGRLVGVLGSGDSATLLIENDSAGVLEVLDASLRRLRSIAPTAEAQAAFAAGLLPFVGELPGGLPRSGQAYLYSGTLLTRPAGAAAVDESPWASFAGLRPIGLVGPNQAEVAVMDEVGELATATRHGGRLADPDEAVQRSPTVASAASLFDPPRGRVDFQPFEADAMDTTADGTPSLAAGPDGFDISFDAPAGSNVLLTLQAVTSVVSERRLIVPDSGHLDLTVPASALPADGATAGASLVVRTPGGHAYVSTVMLRIDTAPPQVSTTTPFVSLGSTVEVRGETEPDTRVVAEGREVPVAADGSFRVDVSAGFVPREVRIEATDRVGNRRVVAPSVVAFVDYRMIPWPIVLLVLLVIVGARLYWRPPGTDGGALPGRRRSQRGTDGLEEIDL